MKVRFDFISTVQKCQGFPTKTHPSDYLRCQAFNGFFCLAKTGESNEIKYDFKKARE